MQRKSSWSLFFFVCIYVSSCKINPDSSRNYDDRTRVFKLHLEPPAGSKYHYDISNQSDMKIETDSKKVNNLNKSDAGVIYQINKDSSGNFLLTISYDKIHLYSKNGEAETDIDADNADATLNPAEKVLGYLKNSKITASLNSRGELNQVTGYKEIGEKFIASLDPNDIAGKKIAQDRWDKTIGEGIVKKNVNELFKIFPDSAVHIGDSWKLSSEEGNNMGLVVKSIFKLKAINDDIAIIQSEGTISSDSSGMNLLDYSNASVDLKGKQQGEYEIETKTGMLISAKIIAKVNGELTMMGTEVPVKIETSVKINGKRLK